MYEETISTIISGTVCFDESVVIVMSGQKVHGADSHLNITIQNLELYQDHKAECDRYIEEFKNHVNDL